MTTETIDHLAKLMTSVRAPGAFSTRRTAEAGDLEIEVRGVGRLRFPLSARQAKALCRIARPAPYGRGEETLLDPAVRDTWKVAKSRVKIDQRRWNRTLLPMLETLRADLGLPEGSRLKAQLRSLLVYAPGQFFRRHQDSEKSDAMIGTLVVTLPSAYKGGVMVIEHQDRTVRYRASTKPLSFIAFYSDCHHELRPVKEGYRIALVYDLELHGEGAPSWAKEGPVTEKALAEALAEHFTTPEPAPAFYRSGSKRPAEPEPPSRLVVLLDHQYTQRGFAWNRLKGDDAARVELLQATARSGDYEMVLALADVHETWSCEPVWEPRRYRRRYWEDDEDDFDLEDGADAQLGELIDSVVVLERCIDAAGGKAEAFLTGVDFREICAPTPSRELEPYDSEYEGYMGNYGDTMDRWYRRAAVVLWPRGRTFAIRAEASPAWGLDELQRWIRAGTVAEARSLAANLWPFWDSAVAKEVRSGVLGKALRVATGLDDEEMATRLLAPFHLALLIKSQARTVVAAVERYGLPWWGDLLTRWADPDRWWRAPTKDLELSWLQKLPALGKAVVEVEETSGRAVLREILEDRWRWLRARANGDLELPSPSLRERSVAKLGRPLLGLLRSTAVAEAEDLRGQILSFLCGEAGERILPALLPLLRQAAREVPKKNRSAVGLHHLREHCIHQLRALLSRPVQDPDDWSIQMPKGCGCELCARLGTFLEDSNAQSFDWPLAKERRRHIHQRLDDHELPVSHETRRSGSPYTLVLRKTDALHQAEARRRISWAEDLRWLEE